MQVVTHSLGICAALPISQEATPDLFCSSIGWLWYVIVVVQAFLLEKMPAVQSRATTVASPLYVAPLQLVAVVIVAGINGGLRQVIELGCRSGIQGDAEVTVVKKRLVRG